MISCWVEKAAAEALPNSNRDPIVYTTCFFRGGCQSHQLGVSAEMRCRAIGSLEIGARCCHVAVSCPSVSISIPRNEWAMGKNVGARWHGAYHSNYKKNTMRNGFLPDWPPDGSYVMSHARESGDLEAVDWRITPYSASVFHKMPATTRKLAPLVLRDLAGEELEEQQQELIEQSLTLVDWATEIEVLAGQAPPVTVLGRFKAFQ